MKVTCVALLALFATAFLAHGERGDKTITKVVKLLQDMMVKSKEEGDKERTLYGKFKCYCDTNDEQKTDQIASLEKTTGLLESAIDNVQSTNGELSSQVAQFKADMASNTEAQESATNIRTKANEAFKAEKTDLTQAIGQMDEAVKTLAAIGGDQTLGKSAEDHKKFMAGVKTKSPLLLALSSEVKTALAAASIFLKPEQQKQVGSFLQGPSFTGSYSSQSGQIVGILKDMSDTFKTNLAEAIATETKDAKSHTDFMKTKKSAFASMESTYKEKQETLGSNDEALTSKKKQLQAATKDKADAEDFLGKLGVQCSKKAKEYEERNLLRANEEAAVSQAISILNSDSAFETFGDVSATSTGKTKAASFMQLNRVTSLQNQLERVLRVKGSSRMARVLMAVEAGNPFEKVLVEIEKMQTLNNEEGKEDKKNLDWCTGENTDNKKNLQDRKDDIMTLTTDTDKLTTTIEDPVKGLRNQIKTTETSLVQNTESQTEQTKQRTEENVAYQSDVKTLVDAQDLLTKAIVVLSKYYDELEQRMKAALLQQAPETWDGDDKGTSYKGQSGKGGDAITMLKFIQSESAKEESLAHADEEKGQASYEDSMADLTKEQGKLQASLIKLNEDLATSEKTLIEKKEDLKDAENAKAKIEDYLLKIKPGCDFISTNFDLREKNRKTETEALTKAVKLIKATPAFKVAAQEAKENKFGECKSLCVADEQGAKCKACQAKVTVPAYCAGHKGTKGC